MILFVLFKTFRLTVQMDKQDLNKNTTVIMLHNSNIQPFVYLTDNVHIRNAFTPENTVVSNTKSVQRLGIGLE